MFNLNRYLVQRVQFEMLPSTMGLIWIVTWYKGSNLNCYLVQRVHFELLPSTKGPITLVTSGLPSRSWKSGGRVFFLNEWMFPAQLATDIWLFISRNLSWNSEIFGSVEMFLLHVWHTVFAYGLARLWYKWQFVYKLCPICLSFCLKFVTTKQQQKL